MTMEHHRRGPWARCLSTPTGGAEAVLQDYGPSPASPQVLLGGRHHQRGTILSWSHGAAARTGGEVGFAERR